MQLEAGLHNVGYRAFRLIGACLLHHCLVAGRIERLAYCVDRFAMVAFQQRFQLLANHANSFEKRIGVGVFTSRCNRTVNVIEDRQELGKQMNFRITALIVQFALRSLAVILQFCLGPEHFVAGFGQLCANQLHFLIGRQLRTVLDNFVGTVGEWLCRALRFGAD